MKSAKLKQILVYTTLAASMTAATAIAATNPAGGTIGTAAGGSIATPPFNPATSSGQTDMNNQNAGTSSNPANTDSGMPTTNAPQGVNNESIQEAVAVCPLQEASEQAIKDAMEVIKIVPNVDEIFNNQTEAAKGCFAASSKVMNLALEIPSFNGFGSSLGEILKKNLTSMIEQKQKEFLAMGCEIADQALLSALSPVQDYLVKYNNQVGAFNGLLGNLDMGEGYEGGNGGFYEGLVGSVGSTIDDAKGRIDADSAAMKQTSDRLAGEYKNILDKAPPITGGGNTGGGEPVPPIDTNSTSPRNAPAARSTFSAPPQFTPQSTPQAPATAAAPAATSNPSPSTNPYGGAPTNPSANNPF